MKQHPQIGYDILKESSSSILRLGASIALTHHEKFDGSGYPHGLAGRDIPIEGRIVAVADVFDALTSERPYKKAWDLDRALQLLREGSGAHFDPECIEAFFAVLEEILAVKARYREPAAAATEPAAAATEPAATEPAAQPVLAQAAA